MSAPRAFGLASVVLTLVTAHLGGPTAQAAPFFTRPIVSATAPVFADESAVGRFFQSFNNRDRIVQLCVVVMLLALVIIIKKFHGGTVDSSFRARERETIDRRNGVSP